MLASQTERWVMQATSLTDRLRRGMVFRDWAWWRLPPVLRWYVGALPVLALAAIGIAAARTDWRPHDLAKFLLLMCCATVSVASTPRIMYAFPGLTRDFSSIWVLPTAILLPPIYGALVPISVVAVLHLYVHRGVMHRMVFTAATLSLSYLAASLVFRWFPASFAGGAVGIGWHAFTWCAAVAACEILGCRVQHFMIVGAVKLSDPTMRIWDMEWDRDALQALFVEIDLGVLITLAVALSPALVLIAFPTVLLVRRFLVFPVLEAQSRVDAKTGLLNVSTWEREAEAELSRAARTGTSLALAVADIDHFKSVNDTHGHLVGDKVLRAVADALTGQLRAYDRAGRFGGEEFVLLLPQTGEEDARGIAERLRRHVANMAVPIDDSDNARCVRLTISIGVSSTNGACCELTDLLAAADAALYYAKRSGRNMTHVVSAAPMINENGQVIDRRDAIAGLCRTDPAGASLCSAMLLYVVIRVHRECAVPQPPAHGPPGTRRRLARVPHRAVVQRPAPRRTREPSRSRGVTPALPSAFRLQCTNPHPGAPTAGRRALRPPSDGRPVPLSARPVACGAPFMITKASRGAPWSSTPRGPAN
jgi:diguanylate cyclase (GGDEF)-like protein